jgi:hypothetical protein
MPYENLDAALSDTDMDEIMFELNNIIALLPFLINLTKKERQQKGAFIRQKNLFTQTAFEMATNETHLVPSNFNMAHWQNDILLLAKLQTIHRKIMQLQEGVDDTIIALKTETAKTSSLFYNTLKLQAKFNTSGVDAMVSKLKAMLSNKKI